MVALVENMAGLYARLFSGAHTLRVVPGCSSTHTATGCRHSITITCCESCAAKSLTCRAGSYRPHNESFRPHVRIGALGKKSTSFRRGLHHLNVLRVSL